MNGFKQFHIFAHFPRRPSAWIMKPPTGLNFVKLFEEVIYPFSNKLPCLASVNVTIVVYSL
jgi:hypothetical protein